MKLFYFPETVEVIANNIPNNNMAYKKYFPAGTEFNSDDLYFLTARWKVCVNKFSRT